MYDTLDLYDTPDCLKFGAYLRYLRTQAGYGLRRLATAAQVSPTHLSAIERGRKCSDEVTERLGAILDAHLDSAMWSDLWHLVPEGAEAVDVEAATAAFICERRP